MFFSFWWEKFTRLYCLCFDFWPHDTFSKLFLIILFVFDFHRYFKPCQVDLKKAHWQRGFEIIWGFRFWAFFFLQSHFVVKEIKQFNLVVKVVVIENRFASNGMTRISPKKFLYHVATPFSLFWVSFWKKFWQIWSNIL